MNSKLFCIFLLTWKTLDKTDEKFIEMVGHGEETDRDEGKMSDRIGGCIESPKEEREEEEDMEEIDPLFPIETEELIEETDKDKSDGDIGKDCGRLGSLTSETDIDEEGSGDKKVEKGDNGVLIHWRMFLREGEKRVGDVEREYIKMSKKNEKKRG